MSPGPAAGGGGRGRGETDIRTGLSPVVRAAGAGEALWAMGSLMEVTLEERETGGALTVMEVTQPPGVATPLHVHRHEAEVFYLLAGTMDYEAGGQLHHLEGGALIWLPKGVPHRFQVTGDTPVRFLGLGLTGGRRTQRPPPGRPGRR